MLIVLPLPDPCRLDKFIRPHVTSLTGAGVSIDIKERDQGAQRWADSFADTGGEFLEMVIAIRGIDEEGIGVDVAGAGVATFDAGIGNGRWTRTRNPHTGRWTTKPQQSSIWYVDKRIPSHYD